MAEGLLTEDNPAAAGETDIWADVPKETRFSAEGNDKLARFTDPASLANSYLEMEKMASGRVKMPTDESQADEINAFYQKLPAQLRAPTNAEGYALPEVGEGQEVDTEFFGAMKTAAFAGNVPASSFGGIVKAYTEFTEARINADVNATEETLQKDWAGDYKANIETVERVFRELPGEAGGDEFKKWFVNAGGGRNVTAMKALLEIGKTTLNDTLEKGDPPKGPDPDFTPKYPNSAEQYNNGDDEESVKSRAWFRAKGHVYSRTD